jgi:hypothetical protein
MPRGNAKRKEAEYFILAYEEKNKKLPNIKVIMEGAGVADTTAKVSLYAIRSDRKKKKSTDPIQYSKAQKGHIEAAIRIYERESQVNMEAMLRDRVKVYLDTHMPDLKARREELARRIESYEKLTNKFKPIFTAEEFRAILMCLHPDGERSKEKLEEVFIMVKDKEAPLTGKK